MAKEARVAEKHRCVRRDSLDNYRFFQTCPKTLFPGKQSSSMNQGVANHWKLPNFFILGAAKCGTTSLYHFLKRHPDIYVSPVKEPCFFCENFQIIKNPIQYARLFDAADTESSIGEASHVYLTDPSAAITLRAFFPDARFVLILRHPADRAYSLYHHMRRYGYETIATFEKALKAEEKRFHSPFFKKHCNQYLYNFFYFRSGLFGEQVERYFALFDHSQFHFVTLDQIMETPVPAIQGIFEFLNARTEFFPEIKVFNKGETSRFPMVQNFLNLKLRRPSWLRQMGLNLSRKYNLMQIPPMNPETRDRLSMRYESDLAKLYELTGMQF